MLYGKKMFWIVLALVGLAFLPACGGGGGGGDGTPPPDDFVSIEPVANAGRDQDVKTGDPVQLDGSGSTNPGGGLLTYSWELTVPAGSAAALSDPAAIRPEFTADLDGVYVATLVVNDGEIDSDVDSVTITATPISANARPIADAGSDQVVAVGDVVTLDGSGSSDADGDSLSYSWSFISRPLGSAAFLTGESTLNPSFTADREGEYLLRLVVNDSVLSSVEGRVIVRSYSSDYVPLFSIVGSRTAGKSNDEIYYLAGSRFGATITNNSDMEFRITKAELYSGATVLGSTEDPVNLGGEVFSPNETVSGGFEINSDVEDNGFEFRYYLLRPDTSETFVVKYLYDN